MCNSYLCVLFKCKCTNSFGDKRYYCLSFLEKNMSPPAERTLWKHKGTSPYITKLILEKHTKCRTRFNSFTQDLKGSGGSGRLGLYAFGTPASSGRAHSMEMLVKYIILAWQANSLISLGVAYYLLPPASCLLPSPRGGGIREERGGSAQPDPGG